ncbi:hypothetical protein l11_09410 [Neisseria weaveri LMG 5135]|nr:hypothetical protein l13_15660 [Neisseria weaveri ATCC 51223]EGV37700.1 hypothetical protein l11_09410 [Neisseria weaveri LMG 5135]
MKGRLKFSDGLIFNILFYQNPIHSQTTFPAIKPSFDKNKA